MRWVVLHHGRLPGPDGCLGDEGVTGGALRAWAHVSALREAGHDVVALHRHQDGPGGFASPRELQAQLRAAAPDAVLCVAPEEAAHVDGAVPLLLDLYAPRLLEAAFEGAQRAEARTTLTAIARADDVLFSNPRQRWFWLGLLGVAGFDLQHPVGHVVPLAAVPPPPDLPMPEGPPRFVFGGRSWPWQDAEPTIRRAVAHLRGRAEVHRYGSRAEGDGVHHGIVGRRAWLGACAGAVAALDRFEPNPERDLALSFRQMDYLACGLPLVSDAHAVIADELRAAGAGWVDAPLEEALDAALAEAPEARAARRERVRGLAARYAPTHTEAPVVAWTPRVRPRERSALANTLRLARAERRATWAEAGVEESRRELGQKHAEVERLTAQVVSLTGSVEALSAAMLDVAAFRRETVAVLGLRLSGSEATKEHLARELEIARADLAKKQAELDALAAERDRMGGLLTRLRGK